MKKEVEREAQVCVEEKEGKDDRRKERERGRQKDLYIIYIRAREKERRESDTRFRIARHETNVFHDTETKREARRRRRRRRHSVKPFKRPRSGDEEAEEESEKGRVASEPMKQPMKGALFSPPNSCARAREASLLKGGALSRWLVIFLKETARSKIARARRETV